MTVIRDVEGKPHRVAPSAARALLRPDVGRRIRKFRMHPEFRRVACGLDDQGNIVATLAIVGGELVALNGRR